MNSFSAVDCGPLSAPKNGSFVGDSTVFPNSLLFACNLGFILDGSYRRTCQANGTWDGLETVCIGKFTVEIEIYFRVLPRFVQSIFLSVGLFLRISVNSNIHLRSS